MCYYDCIVFQCTDWKWGNFRAHCNKEYRIGETCGMKLVYQSLGQAQKCRLCEKLETKYRRRAAEIERITRWQAEGRCPSSVEKGCNTVHQLDQEINAILAERDQRRMTLGSNSRQR